ncbi:MAG: DUF4954 family protein [Calditrichaeota bacterium]|nr:DUF4954 family protein [Calditrichota bacterium]
MKNNEIELLEKSNNYSDNWEFVFISETTDLTLIKNCEFYGPVYIDSIKKKQVKHENTILQTGIYNSCLNNSIIGKNCAIKNVHNLYNYFIEDDSLLFNISEINCSNTASFGNGCQTESGEQDSLEIGNENGGRQVLPFESILPADAFLWSRFREDALLLKKLNLITDNTFDNNDTLGRIGQNSILKNIGRIEDSKIGSYVEIIGATLLKNITVLSNKEEPTKIGDAAELINGIVGYSNKIVHGPKCINFVTGRNVKIELGARVKHTFVGSNSTIACCEVLSNLIFPFHEQHHNNSFLIASTLLGQSNIAAGATIGSNHNSRAADGEILAGRGFWPGLNSSYKHNSRFACFSLIAKGSYETELNVKLPFSLMSIDSSSGQLQIFPAFWFRYNMYALARNSWKFNKRDKRVKKEQNIEMDYLAPDSVAEILIGIEILEQAVKTETGEVPFVDESNFDKQELRNIYLNDIAPKQKVLVIKPLQAIWLYKLMLSYFAAKEILKYILKDGVKDIDSLFKESCLSQNWMNFGGQLIEENDYLKIIADIKEGDLNSWPSVHKRYNDLWEKYKYQKRDFAIQCWLQKEKKSAKNISTIDIIELLTNATNTDAQILQWTKDARIKDYSNPFRQSVYRNRKEMEAVLGKFEEDAFIKEMASQHKQFKTEINKAVLKLQNN